MVDIRSDGPDDLMMTFFTAQQNYSYNRLFYEKDIITSTAHTPQIGHQIIRSSVDMIRPNNQIFNRFYECFPLF